MRLHAISPDPGVATHKPGPKRMRTVDSNSMALRACLSLGLLLLCMGCCPWSYRPPQVPCFYKTAADQERWQNWDPQRSATESGCACCHGYAYGGETDEHWDGPLRPEPPYQSEFLLVPNGCLPEFEGGARLNALGDAPLYPFDPNVLAAAADEEIQPPTSMADAGPEERGSPNLSKASGPWLFVPQDQAGPVSPWTARESVVPHWQQAATGQGNAQGSRGGAR